MSSSQAKNRQKISREEATYRRKLFAAIGNNDVTFVRNALSGNQFGLTANIYNNSGWTLLASAAFDGHIEMMELLLEFGADYSFIPPGNDDGKMPLMVATREGKPDAVRILLLRGAVDKNGKCLQLAKEKLGKLSKSGSNDELQQCKYIVIILQDVETVKISQKLRKLAPGLSDDILLHHLFKLSRAVNERPNGLNMSVLSKAWKIFITRDDQASTSYAFRALKEFARDRIGSDMASDMKRLAAVLLSVMERRVVEWGLKKPVAQTTTPQPS